MGVALDLTRGKMYWTTRSDGQDPAGESDGTEVEDLVTSGLDGPMGLALDLDRAP